jgi:hypothetical protein
VIRNLFLKWISEMIEIQISTLYIHNIMSIFIFIYFKINLNYKFWFHDMILVDNQPNFKVPKNLSFIFYKKIDSFFIALNYSTYFKSVLFKVFIQI